MNFETIPGWMNEIIRFSNSKPIYILSGNIRDIYLFEKQPFPTIIKFIETVLKTEGYSEFEIYDPIDGQNFPKSPLEAIRNVREKLTGNEERERMHRIIFFDYGSRLSVDISHLTSDEHKFFSILQKMSNEMKPHSDGGKTIPKYDLLILLLDKDNDIPFWVSHNNPHIRHMTIPKPNSKIRKEAAEIFINAFPGDAQGDEVEKSKAVEFYASLTEKMLLKDMQAIQLLARKENESFSHISEVIKKYKIGIKEDSWIYTSDKIQKEGRLVLKKHIKGQDEVIERVLDVLARSCFGLSNLHLGTAIDKPKGVLFFAGPTGVGKTQMAKAITELIFGDEKAFIRFDMSEFNQPHSNQRLIGAPPGYVGYDAGGELTNAIKENPFSLILFDEIEKAPYIMDIFLQILDDGRLTDSKGETIYFSETIIVFTSNLGVVEEDTETGKKKSLIDPEKDDYASVKKKILETIENHFRYTLNRPEIFNRIGRENIMVFNFIQLKEAEVIFEKFLNTFKHNVKEKLGITLSIRSETLENMKKACISDLTYGGRGIANEFESRVVNLIAKKLLEVDLKQIHEVVL